MSQVPLCVRSSHGLSSTISSARANGWQSEELKYTPWAFDIVYGQLL